MSLTLTTRELEHLARAAELLLSPLDHDTADAWRSAVNRELMQLLNADSAGFLLPVSTGLALYSDEHDPAQLSRYPDYPPPPLLDGTPLWEQIVDWGVMTLSRGYGEDYHLYLDSVYYQDYAGANGAHDTLVSATSLGGPGAGGLACMHFWHDRPDGRLFGEREIALLRLLHPAFRAGVQAHAAGATERARLIAAFDALGHAVLVRDGAGRVLHETAALAALLAADPEADTLRGELMAVGTALRLAPRHASGPPRDPTPPLAEVEVRTELARYALRASHAGTGDGTGRLILAAIERKTPLPLGDEALRAAYGLTPAEIRVARRLGRGWSNGQIAEDLVMSPHTARRHTERVFHKMGVGSRAEIGAKLFT